MCLQLVRLSWLPFPMHPVLHSSCSTPVPYAPGLTALEIDTSVRAGFPSPAEDFQAERIDVLKHIILHPQATYTLRVRGDSMRDEGIFDDDVILVDRAIKPRRGHIVVAVVDGGPLAMWYATKEALRCFCGRTHGIVWTMEDPPILKCDGRELALLQMQAAEGH